MIRVPGSNHQQAELTARHRGGYNPQVTNQHPAGNQPQVTALIQQVPHTPQNQETRQVGGIKLITQLVGVLQAQEEELIEGLTLGQNRRPSITCKLSGT